MRVYVYASSGPNYITNCACMQVATMVKKWTSWFKRYQRILTSDIIHMARPDGQGGY
jgi:hypothetical protein